MSYECDDESPVFAIFVILVAIFAIIGFGYLIMAADRETTETYELWDARCPFGYFWVDVEGGGFIAFAFDSQLQESYVLKYMDKENVLRTVIVDSTMRDVRVHLTNNTERMWMTITWSGFSEYPVTADNQYNVEEVDIYVPDPKLYATG